MFTQHYAVVAGRITNCAEASDLLRHNYRPGWTLQG
jgi:hypothetical protein